MADKQSPKGLPVLEVSGPRRNTGRRRTGVSAEPVDISKIAAATTRVVPKSENEKKQIREALKPNFLFSSVSDDQLTIVVDAMELKKYDAGVRIINQGEDGEEFYVVGSGECECYLDIKGSEPKMVKLYERGESFGELALMYSQPRAASIVTKTPVTLWAMDRMTFRKVLMYTTSKKRGEYEDFLSRVPLLATMDRYERSKVADALKEKKYADNEYIITQGDTKDKSFFILAEGKAKATKDIDGEVQCVMEYKQGDFFGELALIHNTARSANIVAVGACKVVVIDRDSFIRVLGPVEKLVERKKAKYEEAEDSIRKSLSEMKISSPKNIITLEPISPTAKFDDIA